MSVASVIDRINTDFDLYLNDLLDWLAMPSISTQPDHLADMAQAAEWICQRLTDAGLSAEILPTAGHPAVLADSGPSDAATTVLIYGHYDVQPTGNDKLWTSPAFKPVVREGAVYVRGAADNKGQVFTHVCAVRAFKAANAALPVRVKFLIEGEEEIGSPNLGAFITEHRDRLACDYVAISDTAKFDADTPAITYGTKGLVYKEVRLFGPDRDLHSGSFGGSVANPATVLTGLIASLKDDDDRITIPGFYDDVRDLTPRERELMAALPFDEDAYRVQLGSPALHGEKGYTTLERRWARPTLDVNGLYGGYGGTGAATIIPASAGAKVSMRLVPDQDPQRIAADFDEALRQRCPDGVRLEIENHGQAAAYVAPLDSPGLRAAAAAVHAGFEKKPFFIREGGTLPILPLFKSELGADSLMMGFARPDCNAHSPDEFFHLTDFQAGIRTAAHFLHQIANT